MKNKNKEFVLIFVSVLLLFSLSILYLQNKKLVNKLKDSENEVEFIMTKLNQTETMLLVDSLIFESLANQDSFGLGKLNALIDNKLNYKMLHPILNYRINKTDSISKLFSSKNYEILNANENLNRIWKDLKQNKNNNKTIVSQNTILEKENQIVSDFNKVLLEKLDSINNTNIENLNVIELNVNGKRVFYVGQKIKGQPFGYGVGLWSTGGMYKGEWANGLRNGKGVYIWKDGEIYEGDWVNGMRSGFGKYIWKDKQIYEGGWLENKRHGFGSVYYPNGKLEYEGLWENDKFKQPNKTSLQTNN